MSKNERLYEKVLEAIKELFSDTSISQKETKVALNALIEEIDLLVKTLEI